MNQSGSVTEDKSESKASSSSDINIPEFILKYLRFLDSGFEISQIIKDEYPRLVLRVKIKGRDCLVKAVRNLTLWKKPGRYFRFQKEIFLYSQLEMLEFRHFQYPRLRHTDGEKLIVTDFVAHDPSLSPDKYFCDSAIKAVLELNVCDFPYEKHGGLGWTWEKINRWKFSRSTKTLRHLFEGFFIRRKIPLFLLVETLSFWIKAFLGSTKLKYPLLVHRDIFKANILRPDKRSIYFIDFEKAGLEKRWVFVDALKIAQADPLFFRENEGLISGFPRFKVKLLENYWKDLLSYRPELGTNLEAYKLQLKFCILGWTLKKMVKEKLTPLQEKHLIRFLKTVILGSDEHFENWINNLPGSE